MKFGLEPPKAEDLPVYKTSDHTYEFYFENGFPNSGGTSAFMGPNLPVIPPTEQPGFEGNDRLKYYDESVNLLAHAAFANMKGFQERYESLSIPSSRVDKQGTDKDDHAWDYMIEMFAEYLFKPPKERGIENIFKIEEPPKSPKTDRDNFSVQCDAILSRVREQVKANQEAYDENERRLNRSKNQSHFKWVRNN